MNKYVALFRGLNVGGHNKITMVDLKQMLATAGCQNVNTYIQSGNAVFLHKYDSQKLAQFLEEQYQTAFGYAVDIVIRTEAQLATSLDAYPFETNDREAKFMMTAFARTAIKEEALAVLASVADESELIDVGSDELHFYFGNGSGRSKLAALNFPKKIGTPVTMRNRRTVTKLVEMMATL